MLHLAIVHILSSVKDFGRAFLLSGKNASQVDFYGIIFRNILQPISFLLFNVEKCPICFLTHDSISLDLPFTLWASRLPQLCLVNSELLCQNGSYGMAPVESFRAVYPSTESLPSLYLLLHLLVQTCIPALGTFWYKDLFADFLCPTDKEALKAETRNDSTEVRWSGKQMALNSGCTMELPEELAKNNSNSQVFLQTN